VEPPGQGTNSGAILVVALEMASKDRELAGTGKGEVP
jgi:hypothetical protein